MSRRTELPWTEAIQASAPEVVVRVVNHVVSAAFEVGLELSAAMQTVDDDRAKDRLRHATVTLDRMIAELRREVVDLPAHDEGSAASSLVRTRVLRAVDEGCGLSPALRPTVSFRGPVELAADADTLDEGLRLLTQLLREIPPRQHSNVNVSVAAETRLTIAVDGHSHGMTSTKVQAPVRT